MILEKTIKEASQILKNHDIHSHELDAQIILSDIMGVTREFLITNDYLAVSKKIKKKYDCAIKRRIKKEPVAYIIGKKEFWSQNFKVTSSTLVPRPETELLIYNVIKYLKSEYLLYQSKLDSLQNKLNSSNTQTEEDLGNMYSNIKNMDHQIFRNQKKVENS